MSGAHSVQIENLDYNDARFCQTVAVEPSSFYRLSGYVKAWDTLDEGLGGNLSIKDVYVFSESVYDSPDEWQYVELYGVTDTDQHEVTVYARLGGYSGESFGTAMFDDLSLVKVDAPPEGIVASRWYQPALPAKEERRSAGCKEARSHAALCHHRACCRGSGAADCRKQRQRLSGGCKLLPRVGQHAAQRRPGEFLPNDKLLRLSARVCLHHGLERGADAGSAPVGGGGA